MRPMDIPPLDMYAGLKWKSHEDFRGAGERLAFWVPRPGYDEHGRRIGQESPPPPDMWLPEAARERIHGAPVLEEAMVGIRGRGALSLLTPSGDLVVRSVADNVITVVGKAWINNIVRILFTGFDHAAVQASVDGSISGGSITGATYYNRFLLDDTGANPTATVSIDNPFTYVFLSDVSAAESAAESALPSGTFSPTRDPHNGFSTTDLTKLHGDSARTAAAAGIYLRWDYGTAEANGTWRSIHWAKSTVVGQEQGIRNLLAAAVTKTSGVFGKLEYTFAISIT